MAASDGDPASSPADRLRRPVDRPLETPRAAGVAGLAFAGLFIASILLVRNQPSADSTAAEIRDFYLGKHAGPVALVGVYLAPFAGIGFLWFIAAVRNLIGDREDRFFATAFLGSGLLFVAMLFIAAGAGGSLLAAVKFNNSPVPAPETIVTVRALGFGSCSSTPCGWPPCSLIVASTIGRRLGVFPRWLVITGYLAALVLILNVSYTETLILVFPGWVAAVSVVILRASWTRTLAASPWINPDDLNGQLSLVSSKPGDGGGLARP